QIGLPRWRSHVRRAPHWRRRRARAKLHARVGVGALGKKTEHCEVANAVRCNWPNARRREDPQDTIVELNGVLRALHLERDWLEVLVDGHAIHIDGLNETVDDVIGPMVNRPVIVQVKRKSRAAGTLWILKRKIRPRTPSAEPTLA